MKTNKEIYDEIYGNSLKGIQQKIPDGWGLIKVKGHDPIVHSPSGYDPGNNEEHDLEKEQMAIWDSFSEKDGGDIDDTFSKMPQSVKSEYNSRLLGLMERNESSRDLDREFKIKDDGLGMEPLLKDGQWINSANGKPAFTDDFERKMYETERKKFMEELKKSIDMGI